MAATVDMIGLGSMLRRLLLGASVVLIGLAAPACDDEAGADTESVKVGGEWFHLETALTPGERLVGLGGREFIAEDGGMLFVFPHPQRLAFVMRDCPIPIDVAFLDAAGRVVAIHEMTPEKPQGEDESDYDYERRLKQYPSRFNAQFAIETAGGRLKETELEVGDVVDLDLDRLKDAAR